MLQIWKHGYPKDQRRSNWALDGRGRRETSYYKKHVPSLSFTTMQLFIVPFPSHHCYLGPHEHFLTFTGGFGTWLSVFHSTKSTTFTLHDFSVNVHNIPNLWPLSSLVSSSPKITSIHLCWPIKFILPWNSSTLVSYVQTAYYLVISFLSLLLSPFSTQKESRGVRRLWKLLEVY